MPIEKNINKGGYILMSSTWYIRDSQAPNKCLENLVKRKLWETMTQYRGKNHTQGRIKGLYCFFIKN